MRVVLSEGYPAVHYVRDASVGQRKSDGFIKSFERQHCRAARIILGFKSDMPTADILATVSGFNSAFLQRLLGTVSTRFS